MADLAFRERLLPSWWAWLVSYALIGMVAVAYGAALGAAVGWLVTAGGIAVATWLLWITSPVITVGPDGVGAADALLPLDAVGNVEVVDKSSVAALRGPRGDARMFVLLRPWSASRAVLVTVDDPDDPHPAWLVSTRRPETLRASIRSQLATAGA